MLDPTIYPKYELNRDGDAVVAPRAPAIAEFIDDNEWVMCRKAWGDKARGVCCVCGIDLKNSTAHAMRINQDLGKDEYLCVYCLFNRLIKTRL